MSRLALTPTNVPALSSAPNTPTLRAGDLYFDTSDVSLKVYTGSSWQAIAPSITEIDGGVFDSIAPYNGGDPTSTATQTYDGGTP